jgi:hypothetical protein
LLVDCPEDSAQAILEHIDSIKATQSEKALRNTLNSSAVSKDFFAWVCLAHGNLLTLTTEDMKIPVLDKSVLQFIVSKTYGKTSPGF